MKGHNRLCFLRGLRSFSVCTKMFHILSLKSYIYKSVVESSVGLGLGGNHLYCSSTRDSKKQNKQIRRLAVCSGALEMIVKRRMLHKLVNMKNNTDHPLHNIVLKQKSLFSQRLLQLCCNTEKCMRCFLPAAISVYNESL